MSRCPDQSYKLFSPSHWPSASPLDGPQDIAELIKPVHGWLAGRQPRLQVQQDQTGCRARP